MKKLIFIAFILCLAASPALAQGADYSGSPAADDSAAKEAAAPAAPAATTIMGTIIDNMCANAQSPATLGDFVRTHTKSCATMPQCAASGYSLYSNGRLMKFDQASNTKIEEFLRQGDSKLDVIVEVQETPEGLSLISIRNQ